MIFREIHGKLAPHSIHLSSVAVNTNLRPYTKVTVRRSCFVREERFSSLDGHKINFEL